MLARLQAWLAALGVALAAIAAAWLKGRSAGRIEAKARDDAAYRETRERIDNVSVDDLDADAVRERLRRHARKWPGGM